MRRSELDPDPFTQFAAWFAEALAGAGTPNPNAATLCTVGEGAWPEGRVVLLKGYDAEGLRFFSNYDSAKGSALRENPRAELVFHWDRMERQVRVRGEASKLPRAESEAYFATRPRGAQLGAWASLQSREAPSREAMDARLAEFEAKFLGMDVPCPPHWGGYLLAPSRFEFWQGDPRRFHDRFQYLKEGAAWRLARIYP